MATPSSSVTSPSPPMAYLHHFPGTQPSAQPNVSDTLERDQRKQAVDKFLARAEIAMITRRLRAQLAFASYKAAHNIPHTSLRDLEAQGQSRTASFNRTVVAKRRTAGANNYYNKNASPKPTSAGTGLRRGESAAMAPPTSTSSPRLPPSTVTTGHLSHNDVASSQRNTGQAPNLFASILALPSTKQARTVHNPSDPPIPAPERSIQSPKSRVTKSSPRKDTARPSKVKPTNKNAKSVVSPNKRRKKTSSADKGKEKQRSDDMDVDGEMDMKAAATLTSLFLHNRPSIAGSASSPRSSIDDSEAGSTYSHSHLSQSSTRIVHQKQPPVSAVPSSSALTLEPSFRSQTPPRSGSHRRQLSTPRAAPTDSEAANLMLFLATSPSPARATTKDSKDAAAFRALGSGPLRSKGRVLFQSNTTADRDPAGHEDTTSTAGTSYRTSSTLSRGGESSFCSSISSIGSQLGPSAITTDSSATAHQSQLLPAAQLPLPGSGIPTGRTGKPTSPSPKPGFVGFPSGGGNGNGDLASLDFNFHDFINASPSPSRAGTGHSAGTTVARPDVGLIADMGRKLFDGEQLHHMHLQAATSAAIRPPSRQDERPLGTSIDVHM